MDRICDADEDGNPIEDTCQNLYADVTTVTDDDQGDDTGPPPGAGPGEGRPGHGKAATVVAVAVGLVASFEMQVGRPGFGACARCRGLWKTRKTRILSVFDRLLRGQLVERRARQAFDVDLCRRPAIEGRVRSQLTVELEPPANHLPCLDAVGEFAAAVLGRRRRR